MTCAARRSSWSPRSCAKMFGKMTFAVMCAATEMILLRVSGRTVCARQFSFGSADAGGT